MSLKTTITTSSTCRSRQELVPECTTRDADPGRESMAPARVIDVQDFINEHKLSAIQITIVVLCFLIVLVDGFDTAAIGYIAPALRSQWGVTPAQMAPLFGAGLFGLMIGALIFGPLADRFGRKPVLVLTTFLFGLFTLASALATDVT